MPTFYLSPEDVPFDTGCAGKYLRIGKNSGSYGAMLEMCRETYMKYRDIFQPSFRYKTLKIKKKDPENERVEFEEGFSFSGKGVFRLLRHSEAAAVWLLTLGDEIDSKVNTLEEEDISEAYFLNAAASSVIEGVQVMLQGIVEQRAVLEGFHTSKRFSPGYPGWDLPEQETLISILKAAELGIRLTEAYLMLPQKSLSGIYGLSR